MRSKALFPTPLKVRHQSELIFIAFKYCIKSILTVHELPVNRTSKSFWMCLYEICRTEIVACNKNVVSSHVCFCLSNCVSCQIWTWIRGLIYFLWAVRVRVSIRPRALHPEYSDYIWHFKHLKADNNRLALNQGPPTLPDRGHNSYCCSNNWMVGSNPTGCTQSCLRFSCVCAVECRRGFANDPHPRIPTKIYGFRINYALEQTRRPNPKILKN
jgi:hypothetical protein